MTLVPEGNPQLFGLVLQVFQDQCRQLENCSNWAIQCWGSNDSIELTRTSCGPEMCGRCQEYLRGDGERVQHLSLNSQFEKQSPPIQVLGLSFLLENLKQDEYHDASCHM